MRNYTIDTQTATGDAWWIGLACLAQSLPAYAAIMIQCLRIAANISSLIQSTRIFSHVCSVFLVFIVLPLSLSFSCVPFCHVFSFFFIASSFFYTSFGRMSPQNISVSHFL